MSTFLIWYILGVIGMCIITYYDAKYGSTSKDEHMLTALVFSLLGLVVLLYAIWILYNEWKCRSTNQH